MTSAQQDTTEACPYVTGVSFSMNLAFHFGCTHGQNLRCGLTSRVLFLISNSIMLVQCKSTNLDFTLMWDGRPIARGTCENFICQQPQQQLNETDSNIMKKASDFEEPEVGSSTYFLYSVIKAPGQEKSMGVMVELCILLGRSIIVCRGCSGQTFYQNRE